MRTRLAQEILRNAMQRAGERARGLLPAPFPVSASRSAETNIADISRLPVVPDARLLQDEDGLFFWNPDYSSPDGPDVLGP